MSKDAVDQSVEEENTLLEDLEDAVAASLDETEEKEPEVEDESEEVVAEETEEESEEEVKDEVSEEVAESEEEEAEEEVDESIDAPEHWAAADREMFDQQTPEAQSWLIDRHKAMEGDYTRKNQELASIRRRGEAVDDALSPYREEFSQAGLDDAGAIRQLASWHAMLRSNPAAGVKKLAEMYGADMTQTDDSDEFADPAIVELKTELQELKQNQTRQTEQAQQDTQATLARQIQEFEEAKDDSGNLTHPHFKEVYEDMVRLFNNGMSSDLGDAYNKAVAWKPELTQTAVSTPKEEQAPVKTDRAKRVKKAKKAATGVKSSGASSEKKSDMTLRDEIASLVG